MGNVSLFLIVAGLLSGAISSVQGESRPQFTVGVCTHFSQGKGIIELNLQCMKAAGITAIRDEAGWQGVEQVKGRYRMSKHNDRYVRAAATMGLDVMMILDYANPHYDDGDRPRSRGAIEGFCQYAEFMVQHFGKDIRLYEIWNEWDIGISYADYGKAILRLKNAYGKKGIAPDDASIWLLMKKADASIENHMSAHRSWGMAIKTEYIFRASSERNRDEYRDEALKHGREFLKSYEYESKVH